MDESCNLAFIMENRSRSTGGFSPPIPVRAGCSAVLTAAFLFTAQIAAQSSSSVAVDTAPATGWQPKIHFYAPPNWINDPNGPILLNGQYQMFFQFNPFGDQWGHMSWGHAVSPDLVHWKQLPVAIPEESGIGIFSGSTVEDGANTSGLCGEAGEKTPGCLGGDLHRCLAGETDAEHRGQQGRGFDLDEIAANPVIDAGLKLISAIRESVLARADAKSWVMVVSASGPA